MNKPLPEDPMMRDLIKMARRHQMTRRTALAGASATAAALALAACAPGGAGKKTLTPAVDTSDADKSLIWSNWSLYIDVDDKGGRPTLERFSAEQGINVEYREDYDDNDTYFAKVKDQALPGWAAEAGIGSWAQLFLKFAISHPAVTTVIPATSRPDRQLDQLKAGHGPMLTQAQQQALIKQFA